MASVGPMTAEQGCYGHWCHNYKLFNQQQESTHELDNLASPINFIDISLTLRK